MVVNKGMKRIAAITLDIDGVLLRGGEVIAGAKCSLEELTRRKLPFIFMTNGGGCTEVGKAQEMRKKFNLPLDQSQFILSHTPFKEYIHQYSNKSILVIGKEDCKQVANSYGFKHVYSTTDFLNLYSGIYPCLKSQYNTNKHNRYDSLSVYDPLSSNEYPIIDAAFIYHDSINWGVDIQILTDVVLGRYPYKNNQTNSISPTITSTSNIDLNTTSLTHTTISNTTIINNVPSSSSSSSLSSPSSSSNIKQLIPIFSSNADLIYASEYPYSRYTQGAFISAFKTVFYQYTGIHPHIHQFGKPESVQYEYAEKILQQQVYAKFNEEINGISDIRREGDDIITHMNNNNNTSDKLQYNEFNDDSNIVIDYYMIGDNPKSDIRGARSRGTHWTSILVRTGVYNDDNSEIKNDPTDPADYVVDNIYDAIQLILSKY